MLKQINNKISEERKRLAFQKLNSQDQLTSNIFKLLFVAIVVRMVENLSP